ncbi:MAG TPA: ATP-dependent DNA helicase PcrA, partial [Candidatus Peregrinibacteria bacterium]|nr:ATP-dependent DNA helicase PcrA [Candidatus Peregrinibacteria bacterium]
MLKDLNKKQQEAIETTEGPVLIIAGAGSGKTRALTYRVAYLIKEKKVKPWQIFAVTFTNKAAGEMKERVRELVGIPKDADFNSNDQPMIGTFHATCVQILRREIHHLGYENRFVIFDDTDQLSLMKRLMKAMQISDKNLNPKAVLGNISNAKNHLIGPDEYARKASTFFEERVAKVYPLYQKELRKNNALDFDDLIMITVELFQKYESILDKYQSRWQYVLVDEYQDTNEAQYQLVKLLAEGHRNLCVVGDPDQMIYSWRGANIQNILNFEKDYPEAKVIKLEQNYRSTQNILKAANAVIYKNRKRVEKELWTDNEEGSKVMLGECDSERHEADYLIQKIKEEKDFKYKDFVILYRMNAQSRVLEEAFLRHGIPYKIIGGVRFYSRKEIKDILAYLRLIHNPYDDVSLLRIINTPPRKIGARTLQILQEEASQSYTSLYSVIERIDKLPDLNEGKRETFRKFRDVIKKLQSLNGQMNASHLIKELLIESGYKKFLQNGSEEGEIRMENVWELVSVAQKYDDLEPGVSLATFLEEAAL